MRLFAICLLMCGFIAGCGEADKGMERTKTPSTTPPKGALGGTTADGEAADSGAGQAHAE